MKANSSKADGILVNIPPWANRSKIIKILMEDPFKVRVRVYLTINKVAKGKSLKNLYRRANSTKSMCDLNLILLTKKLHSELPEQSSAWPLQKIQGRVIEPDICWSRKLVHQAPEIVFNQQVRTNGLTSSKTNNNRSN